jgi:hypothetical protein
VFFHAVFVSAAFMLLYLGIGASAEPQIFDLALAPGGQAADGLT